MTMLTDFQGDYRDESVVELVSFRPPSYRDANTGVVQEAEAATLGMNLSGAMVKLLERPGGVRALLRQWDRYCRSRHTRWPDHATEPMCARLAWMTIRDQFSVSFAADVLGVSFPRAERLLDGALRQMLHWQQLEEKIDPSVSHDPEYCQTCRMERVG